MDTTKHIEGSDLIKNAPEVINGLLDRVSALEDRVSSLEKALEDNTLN